MDDKTSQIKDAGILTIGNGKGGVGKSTFTVHSAYFFSQHGYKVIVVDLDNQGNSSGHLLMLNSNTVLPEYVTRPTSPVHNLGDAISLFLKDNHNLKCDLQNGSIGVFRPTKALANINTSSDVDLVTIFKDNISKLLKYKTVIIFDTPPTLSNLMLLPLSVSNVVLIPTMLKQYASDGIRDYLSFANKIKKTNNPKLLIGGIVPNMVNLKSNIQKNELSKLLEVAEQTNLFYQDKSNMAYITDKNVIEEAVTYGTACWHINKTSSRDVKRTFTNIFKQVGTQLKLSVFNTSGKGE
ncbi:CobQ/CobB/MinD/ParA nucleotide binding domain protein (plasmid) [Acinetobacter baumannii Naval-18]|nr:AAA family ATPase [Acinetobacter baumannii]EJP48392.1 CobQ/CobB/MinD/ParA nucleotide binding domain protein [Acinetobacter baumannii Naval-18]